MSYRQAINNKKRRKIRKQVLERDGPDCWYCGIDSARTLDHVWPRWFCEEQELPTWIMEHPENKRLSCEPCNENKSGELPGSYGEFLEWVQKMISSYPDRVLMQLKNMKRVRSEAI